MSNGNLKQILIDILKKEESFCDSDSGELNYIKVKDFADKTDKNLISLLADNKDLKKKFFTKIKDMYVFNIQDFKFFLDESKVDNSYTKYANKIGLANNAGLTENISEVVLDFPFKDCVLEGGQSSEEGIDTYYKFSDKTEKYEEKKTKRNEVFFNQVLAHNEIDRLFERKALVNWKRFTGSSKKGGEPVKEIKLDETGFIQENLIIKGNNLLALHSLKSKFAGKVKVIYIDPPYNTRTDANTFAYNNNFNHSAWLTFMKNRLEIARELLTEDGIIFIDIDHYELFYLGVLTDEIFGYENRLGVLAVVHNLKGRYNGYFSVAHENKIVYARNKDKAVIKEFSYDNSKDYPLEDEISKYKPSGLQRTGDGSKREERPNLFYPIYYSPKSNEICLDKKAGYIEILPIDDNGVERRWRWGKTKVAKYWKTEMLVKEVRGKHKIYTKIRIKGDKPKTIWQEREYSGTSGTNELKKLVGEGAFSYPKSVALVKDSLQISTNKDDIILDFFGGSGTTAQAVLELNKEDNGSRKFILVEQMNYIESTTTLRINNYIKQNKMDASFVYTELAKWNEKIKEDIQEAKDLTALIKLFDILYERYFLNYNVKIKDFKAEVIKQEEFKKLTLLQQKKMFLTMLDLNQMYVNESEMADTKYNISSEDQKLTKAFYSKK